MSKNKQTSNILQFNIPKNHENDSGIYMITNSTTNQVYIGRTLNFQKRYKQHLYNLIHDKENYKIKTVLLLYPKTTFTFSILEITQNIVEREEYYIKYYDSVNKGFNVVYSDKELTHSIRNKLRQLDSYKEYVRLRKEIHSQKSKEMKKLKILFISTPNMKKSSCVNKLDVE